MKTNTQSRTQRASQGQAPAKAKGDDVGTPKVYQSESGEFTVVVRELNGWPVCALYDAEQYEAAGGDEEKERKAFLLGFGVRKAKAIVACVPLIERFIKLADTGKPAKK